MRSDIPEKGNACAVIVTYHPDADFSQRVACIAKQVAQVVVVDNHSGNPTVAMLQNVCIRPKIKLILNDRNLGVATALNQGMNLAQDMSFSWVLMFDQDTEPFDSMVDILANVYENYIDNEKLAIIGSNYYQGSSCSVGHKCEPALGRLWIERKTVITSGSLLRVSAFQKIGAFRDELFIDHVDHEYCLRARTQGFKVIATCEPIMKHHVGEATSHKFLKYEIKTSNHSALRRYYMARNEIILAKKFIFKEPMWVFEKLYSRCVNLILICLFEKNKLVKLKFTALGLFDGLLSNYHRKLDTL